VDTLILLSLGGAAVTVAVGAYNYWRARREAERLAEVSSKGIGITEHPSQLLTEELTRSSIPGLSEDFVSAIQQQTDGIGNLSMDSK
jgi:hypothetical protein